MLRQREIVQTTPYSIELEKISIENVRPPADGANSGSEISNVYDALNQLSDRLLASQASGKVHALVLHRDSQRPTRTIALGGYLFEATLSRTWPTRALATDDGAMLVIESKPDEFYVAGSGLTVSFQRDPDTDSKLGGIASIEEVTRANDTWATLRRLNGDQDNQGRQLQMDPHQVRIYRLVLYAIDRYPAANTTH